MKIIIGTAQLGLNYGITNEYGKPSIQKSLNIIKKALDNDITTFDTARAYGDSEYILGLAMQNYNNLNIITKLDPLSDINKITSNKDIYKMIDNSINTSIKNLNLCIIDTLLVHRFSHYNNKIIWNYLLKNKIDEYSSKNSVKKIKKLGVSIYYVNEGIKALKDKNVKHIQLPINILDNQWFNKDFLNLVKNRSDVTIHCRSIFLQGILISSEDKWPKLNNINSLEYVEKINNLINKFNLNNKIELCISYIKSIDWIDGLLMGVDNVEQLNKNIEIFKVRTLNKFEFNYVRQLFKNVPESLLNPSKWK